MAGPFGGLLDFGGQAEEAAPSPVEEVGGRRSITPLSPIDWLNPTARGNYWMAQEEEAKRVKARGMELEQRTAMDALSNSAAALVEKNPGVAGSELFRMMIQDPNVRKNLMKFPAGTHSQVLMDLQSKLAPGPKEQKFGSSVRMVDEMGRPIAGTMATSPSEKIQYMEWLKMNYNDPVVKDLLTQTSAGDKTQTERATAELQRLGIIDNEKRLRINAGMEKWGKDITGRPGFFDQSTNTFYPVDAAPGQQQQQQPGQPPQQQQPANRIGQAPSPTSPQWTPTDQAGQVQPAEEFSKTVTFLKQLDKDPTLIADVAGAKGTIPGWAGTILGTADPRYSQPLINASRRRIGDIRAAFLEVAGSRPLKSEYEDLRKLAPDPNAIFDNAMFAAISMREITKKMESYITRADQERSRQGATVASINDWLDLRLKAEKVLQLAGRSAQWEEKIASVERGESKVPYGEFPASASDIAAPIQREVDEAGKQQTTAPKPDTPKSQERVPPGEPQGPKVKPVTDEDAIRKMDDASFAQMVKSNADAEAATKELWRAELARRKRARQSVEPSAPPPEVNP